MRSIPTIAFAALLLAAPAGAEVAVDLGALDQVAPAQPGNAQKQPTRSGAPAPGAGKKKAPAMPSAPVARAEEPAPPPPAPVVLPPKKPVASPPPAPAPVVIEMPPEPKTESAALDQGALQRPEAVPDRPALEELAAPAELPPSRRPPRSDPFGAVAFAPGAAELSPEAKEVLSAAAERLTADERLRIELLAYAALEDQSQARRLSLSRALAARSFLVEHGVRTQRIDVRPLGAPGDGGGDRIDVRLARR